MHHSYLVKPWKSYLMDPQESADDVLCFVSILGMWGQKPGASGCSRHGDAKTALGRAPSAANPSQSRTLLYEVLSCQQTRFQSDFRQRAREPCKGTADPPLYLEVSIFFEKQPCV